MTRASTQAAKSLTDNATLSPADALHAEEARRTRAFLRAGWVLAGGILAVLPILPGNRRIAYALAGTLLVGLAGSVWMYRHLANPAHYDSRRMNVLAGAAVVCGQLGILYTGAFSAAPLVVALGLYFFCRTEHVPSAIAIYAFAAGSHAAEAALVIAGVVPDPGFYPISASTSIEAQIAGQLNLQFAYGLCFWLARITRQTSLRSIEQLQQATRLAAQHDVQVAELRRDLERVLEIGGPGRFTDHVVGAWRLGNLIGRGAMGEVYEATHVTTGVPAAVKLLRRELLGDSRHVERFLREVRIAGAIESPHVVRVLEASEPDEPLPFLAMERLTGQTLGELLRGDGKIDLATLVTQVASVLEQTRAAGIVHRDLKPQNLMLANDTWKILDFGIALLDDSSGTLTRGGVVGTPAYMAPEQARGEAVDHRADIYSLAAVAYRCICGRSPYAGSDTPSILYNAVHTMPLRPSAISKVPIAVDRVLAIGLAKSRDARFQTATELAEALVHALDNRVTAAVDRRSRALLRDAPWAEPEASPPEPSSRRSVRW